MPGRYMIPNWKPADIIPVLIPSIASLVFAFYILAFPPSTALGRKLSTFFLGILVFFAFRHSDHVAPNFDACDTFARSSIMWFAHMSYELNVLEYAPDVQPGPGEIKERFRQALKVFYDCSRNQVLEEQRKQRMKASKETKPLLQQDGDNVMAMTDKKTDEPIKAPDNKRQRAALAHYQHGYTRWQLVRYHVIKGIALYIFFTLWDTYTTYYSPINSYFWTFIERDYIPFLTRLPRSFDWRELYWRAEETINWSLIGMWFYESFHSACAVIHVGLGIDGPDEWSLQLFGDLQDAWTVRRYWGKYWHNFIYHSFSGHVKCMTRGWIGMKRGTLLTRLVENTLVFFFSGVMHSIVRWQEEPDADFWSVTWLYTAQMIPIVLESVVIHYWRKARRALGYGPEAKWMDRAEYAIGYFWVFAWMFYSVPTYWIVRAMLSDKKSTQAHMASLGFDSRNETTLED